MLITTTDLFLFELYCGFAHKMTVHVDGRSGQYTGRGAGAGSHQRAVGA